MRSNTAVAGGYMDYVLMERIPGIMPPVFWVKSVSEEERAQLLESFKRAFMWTLRCKLYYITSSLTLALFPGNVWLVVQYMQTQGFRIFSGTGRNKNVIFWVGRIGPSLVLNISGMIANISSGF